MSSPFGFRSHSSRLAAPRPKHGPVLAVGSRATIACDVASGRVSLRDYAYHETVATVGEWVEVEVVAWQPHRSDGARYRVRIPGGVDEGWLTAAQLTPRPRPVVVKIAPPPPPPAPRRAVRAAGPRARRPRPEVVATPRGERAGQ